MKQNQGFTLIELLVVIAIIGVLASSLVPSLLNVRKRTAASANTVYASQVAKWLAAADTAATSAAERDGVRAITDCVDPALVGEGAVASPPSSVATCKIVYSPEDERFIITATSSYGDVAVKTY